MECFFDPRTGDGLICDNDSVAVDGSPVSGGFGTMRFMAPELIRKEAWPSTSTDLFSLAVVLFYLLVQHHPLEGRKELEINSLDVQAMERLFGTEPVFVFDPDDESNRPVPGHHVNLLALWPLYPKFLHDLFVKAFSVGLHDPNARVGDKEWWTALTRLRNSIVYCFACGAQNFEDANAVHASTVNAANCWHCHHAGPMIHLPWPPSRPDEPAEVVPVPLPLTPGQVEHELW